MNSWLIVCACILASGCFGATSVLAAYHDSFNCADGRKLHGAELVQRFHPVAAEPEVDIGAESPRKNDGKDVRAHFGRIVAMPNGDMVVVHNEQDSGSHSWNDTNTPLARTSSDGR